MLKQKQDGTMFLWDNAACRKFLMLEEEPASLQTAAENPGTAKGSTSSANTAGKSRGLSHTWTLQTRAPRGLILHNDIVYHGYFSQRIVLPK